MNDGKYFGLTPTQLNLAFLAVVAALAVGGVFAVGGPNQVLDEARSFVGMEEETPVFVRPPVTTEETHQAAPVNPASAPVEQPEAVPVEEPAPSDPTGDYLLGQTSALAQAVVGERLEAAKPIPHSDKGWTDYYGAPYQDIPGGVLVVKEVVPGYTSAFSGAFTATASLPVGTICYGYNSLGYGTWTGRDGQIRSDPCEEDYTPYRTSITVSQDGKVSGSWEINNEQIGSALCTINVIAFFDVYYEGEYVSTEPVSFDAWCEYDDPFYNGPEATETFFMDSLISQDWAGAHTN